MQFKSCFRVRYNDLLYQATKGPTIIERLFFKVNYEKHIFIFIKVLQLFCYLRFFNKSRLNRKRQSWPALHFWLNFRTINNRTILSCKQRIYFRTKREKNYILGRFFRGSIVLKYSTVLYVRFNRRTNLVVVLNINAIWIIVLLHRRWNLLLTSTALLWLIWRWLMILIFLIIRAAVTNNLKW